MGDPGNASDPEKIHEAASLGGALEFIDKLPKGMETLLERPVQDASVGPAPARRRLYQKIHGPGGKEKQEKHVDTSLSGGQMQR
jgi:ABC-type multidrug transport system fused ATPase/permease subunit